MTLAVLEPTIGCRQYADRLCDQGFAIAKSTVQRHLVAHGLGTRQRRLARAAAITAATTGLVTEVARDDEPYGFCLFGAAPGALVCVDSFYVGNLKGVGKVYQLSAIDVCTRVAFVWMVLGTPDDRTSVAFVHRLLAHYRRHGVTVRAVERQRPRIQGERLHGRPRGQADHPRADPAAQPQPQRRGRAVPRHDPPGVLAAGLPPSAVPLGAPAPARGRRLAHHLPPPSQPRRLHEGSHARRGARPLPSTHSSMTTNHRAHLSPQPSVRKV